jgi:hypothetical protein
MNKGGNDMLGRIQHGNNAGEAKHVLMTRDGEVPLQAGTSIKVKMQDEWRRGRYEYDTNDGRMEAVLFAGDKMFYIPDGSEVELV